MPHWINLSFYSTNKKVGYSSFIPRIKLPPLIKKSDYTTNVDEMKKLREEINFYDDSNTEYIHNSLFDYDAYDAQVFALPNHVNNSIPRTPRTKKTSVPSLDALSNYSTSVTCAKEWDFPNNKGHRRKMSDPDIHHTNYNNIYENDSTSLKESVSQSTLSIAKPRKAMQKCVIRNGRALINPFDPSHVTIKLTSNRRRWSHIFPKGPTGVLIQQHHYQAVPTNQSPDARFARDESFTLANSEDYVHTAVCQVGQRQKQNSISKSFEKFDEDFNRSSANNTPIDRYGYLNEQSCELGQASQIAFENPIKLNSVSSTPVGAKRKPSVMNSPFLTSVTTTPSKTLLWGATGEQEWTPALTTGEIIGIIEWQQNSTQLTFLDISIDLRH